MTSSLTPASRLYIISVYLATRGEDNLHVDRISHTVKSAYLVTCGEDKLHVDQISHTVSLYERGARHIYDNKQLYLLAGEQRRQPL